MKVFTFPLKLVIIAFAYVCALQLGELANFNNNLLLLSPAAGIALSILLLLGNPYWPSILLGGFISVYLVSNSLLISVLIAVINTVEAILGNYIITRFIGQKLLHHPRSIFLFTGIVAFLNTLPAALFKTGVVLFSGNNIISINNIWWVSWLNDATSIILIALLVLSLTDCKKIKYTKEKFCELGLLYTVVILVSLFIFDLFPMPILFENLTYKYLVIPILVWAAFRFSAREVAAVCFMISTIAISSTILGLGPFIAADSSLTFFALNIYIIVITITVLLMSALVSERNKAEYELTNLERLQVMGELAAGLAHEIRNPMTVVRGFLQLFSERADSKREDEEYYKLMIGELDRANSIITEYLSMAKNKSMEFKYNNLNNILNNMLPLLKASAYENCNLVELELGNTENFLMNEAEIRQLILNISRNGFEAMTRQGVLTLKTYMNKDKVTLEIEDQGCGIKAEHLTQLGSPFFTTKEKGTGLGLAISYSIAERHKANVKIKTNEHGTAFIIEFPSE